MEENVKCVEYYFDSNKYNETEVIETMKKEEKEFENKKAKIEIYLNKYGIYVAQLKFKNNSITVHKRKAKTKTKYGGYKETRTYSPI